MYWFYSFFLCNCVCHLFFVNTLSIKKKKRYKHAKTWIHSPNNTYTCSEVWKLLYRLCWKNIMYTYHFYSEVKKYPKEKSVHWLRPKCAYLVKRKKKSILLQKKNERTLTYARNWWYDNSLFLKPTAKKSKTLNGKRSLKAKIMHCTCQSHGFLCS